MIYTDQRSKAQIKLLKGHNLEIGENSLIRLSSVSKGNALNVERGFIRAKIEGGEPLIIDMNGSEMVLTGESADVQINLQGDVGEIGVIKGEVEVAKDGKVETLNEKLSLKVSENEIKTEQVTITLLEPVLDENIYTIQHQNEVYFRWSSQGRARISVSQSPSFKDAFIFEGTESIKVSLEPGSYYWQVEDKVGASLIGHFSLIQEVQPKILRPLDGEKLILPIENEKSAEIFLQWEGAANTEYVVEWNDGEIHSKKVLGSGSVIELTESALLKWRVKVSDDKRPLAQWSEWQEVPVELITPPMTPVELSPEELELQSYTKESQEVVLKWKSSLPVELELLDPTNERTVEVISGSSHTLMISRVGQYRWRLRSQDSFQRSSEWTEWKNFTLEDLSEEVRSQGVQLIQLKKPDQAVTFNWEENEETTSVFELSEEKDFSQVIVRKEVKGNEVKISIPKTGSYFWRSREFHSDGTFEVSEAKRVIIEPAPAPEKPEKLPELEVPIEWRETNVPQKQWWDFFLARAFADELRGVATIRVPENEDAKKYLVRIYKDEAGTELILEKISETPVIEWTDVRPGNYYWQYAVIDFWERQSPFSDLSLLKVTGEELPLPEKPRLLNPIRKEEVDSSEINFRWTKSPKNSSYTLEISGDRKFTKIIRKEVITKNHYLMKDLNLKPGLYFWRLKATNKSRKEVLSNTGRFTVLPPLERIVIADQKVPWIKKYSKRLTAAWTPSADTYDFEGSSKKATIDGTALNGFEVRGLWFTDKFIFGGEILRQSGEVFEGESYLFQRAILDAGWKVPFRNHLFSFGLGVGQVSGVTYSISGSDEVSGESVSGLIYGPALRGHFALNQQWELETKLSYFLGEIPQTELTLDVLRDWKNIKWMAGIGYSTRTYDEGDGSQSSIRLILGIGKDF